MVGIRGLEPYLRERKLIGNTSLESLRGTRLGIDATHYITTLLSDPTSREPLVASTGGLPLALPHRIENDLRVFESYKIIPVFILAGLPLASRPPLKGVDLQDRETHVKQEAWSYYENGEVEKAVMTLASVRGGAWTDHRDVLRLVLRQLRHRYVEYIVAPYLEYAQLAYLLRHPKGYIHAIYSSSECLLFPVDKVITSIDFSGSFNFVDKSRLLLDLGMTDDQFLDTAVLAGCSLSRTFPPLANDFTIRSAIDLIKQYKSGIVISRQIPNYGEAFMRARLAVKYSLVLTTEGNVVPLPLVLSLVDDIPPNLEEIFSPRLPDELYYHLCRAFVSPQVLGWLTSGMIIEPQPLADSPEYRRFIKDVITEGHTSPRCTSLALLAESLHPHWKRRTVSAHYYFDPAYASPGGIPIPFADVLTHNLVEKCNWVIPSNVLSSELLRQNSSTIDMKLCLSALHSPVVRIESRPIEKKDEVVANIVWRFLDVRGFINPDRTHNVMGKAMHAGCQTARVNDRFQEALYLVLELLRAGVVHGSRFGNEILSGGPSYGEEDEQRSALLIMRCLSVLPLQFRPQQWAGPLSRELLTFNSFVRAVSKSMRQLLEAIGVHMVLSGDARRNRDDYLDLITSLPFQSDVNTGFGILAKTYLDAALFHLGEPITAENANSEAAMAAKKEALNFIDNSFSSVRTPRQEIERGFRFWDTIMVAVRTLVKEQPSSPVPIVAANVAEEFERADRWLRPMRM